VEPRSEPPVTTTSTRVDASSWATSSEFVTTVRSWNRPSRRASSCVVLPRAHYDGIPLVDQADREVGHRCLLRSGYSTLLPVALLVGQASREHRATAPSIDQSVLFERSQVATDGNRGGLHRRC